MKANWLVLVVLLALAGLVGFWILEKEGRATDYRRCRGVLKGVFQSWESRGRPGLAETQAMLDEWKGTKPHIFTNSFSVGTNQFQAVFALPAKDFGEKGTLVIATNGVLIRVLEGSRASIIQ